MHATSWGVILAAGLPVAAAVKTALAARCCICCRLSCKHAIREDVAILDVSYSFDECDF